MIDIIVAIISTVGALAILLAAIGIVRMPDFYLRLSVTVKAATLGVGLFLICAAIVFANDVSVRTKSIAIVFFLIITGPIAAHMISRAAYINKTPLWKNTVLDELDGMYNRSTHELESNPDHATHKSHSKYDDQIADSDEETE